MAKPRVRIVKTHRICRHKSGIKLICPPNSTPTGDEVDVSDGENGEILAPEPQAKKRKTKNR